MEGGRLQLMNNKNTLYIIITVLVLLNIITISMLWGRQLFSPVAMMGRSWSGETMGAHAMMHSHDIDRSSGWEEMNMHMGDHYKDKPVYRKVIDKVYEGANHD